jgi:hypothetical protein
MPARQRSTRLTLFQFLRVEDELAVSAVKIGAGTSVSEAAGSLRQLSAGGSRCAAAENTRRVAPRRRCVSERRFVGWGGQQRNLASRAGSGSEACARRISRRPAKAHGRQRGDDCVRGVGGSRWGRHDLEPRTAHRAERGGSIALDRARKRRAASTRNTREWACLASELIYNRGADYSAGCRVLHDISRRSAVRS